MGKKVKIDHYNYSDELFRRLIYSHDFANPYQLELQTGIHCDLYMCNYCYGHGQPQMRGIIGPEVYERLLSDVEGKVKLVQLSGISTEPLTNPHIVEILTSIKSKEFICGIHTKGYRMDSELRDILTNDIYDLETYVTFSLDASNMDDYIKVHDIPENKTDGFNNTSKDYFDKVISNIKKLDYSRKKNNSKLRINIAFLITKHNYSLDKVENVIELIIDHCDVLRLSMPQSRNDGIILDRYFDGDEAKKIMDDLNMKYQSNDKVRILDESADNISHKTSFNYCYAQLFQFVVDKAGYVFPCPQVPSKSYSWLAYGNLTESDIYDILNSVARKDLLSADVDNTMKCRVCDRKDEAINLKLSQISGDQDPALINRNL